MAGCRNLLSSRTLRKTAAGLAMVLVGLAAATQVLSAMTWEERTGSGTRKWSSIASSSDGMKLAAVDFDNGYIYTSSDGGTTWTERTGAGRFYWGSITSSSDGQKLAAAADYIYTSSDGGESWSDARAADHVRTWTSIVSSSNGTRLAAVASYCSDCPEGNRDGDYIYTSSDSGENWTAHTSAGKRYWYSIASSSDGNNLAAVDSDEGYIYTSSDGGETWTEQPNSPQADWNAVASSSDGTKLAAVADPCDLYTSTNSGKDWVSRGSISRGGCYSIVSSSDGTKLAVAAYGENYTSDPTYVYTSTDSGANWTPETSAGARDWNSVASSSDGTKLAAGAWKGYIYTGTSPTSIDLISFKAAPAGSGILLKWQTGAEIDTVGFHLWRVDATDGDYSRITRSVIPAKGDLVSGAFYSYGDSGVNPGERFFYALEDMDQNGVGTFHGPVSATAGSIRLIAPGNQAGVAADSAPHFRWKSILYNRFKLQVSKRSDFKSGTINLAGDGKWVSNPSYTPTRVRWKKAVTIAGSAGAIYWRILGKDPAGGEYTSAAFKLVVGK